MEDAFNNIILKTKPSLRTIGFGLIGTLFFGALAYSMTSSKWTVADGTDYKTGILIMWIVLGLFIIFMLACLWSVCNIKTIVLTNDALIIKRPLLLRNKTILIENIKNINERPFKINPKVRGVKYDVYEGKQITIECIQGKSVTLNSFEIPDFFNLANALYKLRGGKKINSDINEENLNNENQGYGWLILICLLTVGLVYSIIRQKL
jgi:hypothetical protein